MNPLPGKAAGGRIVKRIVISVIGGTVTVLGIAMIVLPGPAFIVIPIGLAILATEYLWAKRLLRKAGDLAARFQQQAQWTPTSTAKGGSVITVSELRFSYGNGPAVDGISFGVRAGEIFGLLGPNGAGKSTTIHLICGVLTPSEGEVRLDGGDPKRPETRRRLGVAPQALSLYEDLTGEENCAFFGRLNGLSAGELKARTARALDLAGLTDRARDRVSAYSGGMKRRLNLAVALIHDPPVLLLDEPTVGVDPQSRNHLFDSIEALRGEGRAILCTTHYMEEAQRLCDRVAVMDHGRIMDLGAVDELISRHGGPSVVEVEGLDHSVAVEPLGGVRDGDLSRFESPNPMVLLQTLADRKAAYAGLRIHRADLETVFLNLTGRRLRD